MMWSALLRLIDRWSPALVAALFLAVWEWLVRAYDVPVFILPAPSAIGESFVDDGPMLLSALRVTIALTLKALFFAVVAGAALAALFVQSRAVERALFPYAVALQVTPVVAIAPLILIWVGIDHAGRAVVILASIVAFFPVLSNTAAGLRAVDPDLDALFRLYGASRWQRLRRLQAPSAIPYFINGLKVAAGLALIGVIVAEFVAGSGETAGLAWRIIEAGNRLEIARMFAALVLLSLTGLALYAALTWAERRALARWSGRVLSPAASPPGA